MILGAEKSVESGRLVFVLQCEDCQAVFLRDALETMGEDVQALPSRPPRRCGRCQALWEDTFAGAVENLGEAAAALKRALLDVLEGLLVKLRIVRRP